MRPSYWNKCSNLAHRISVLDRKRICHAYRMDDMNDVGLSIPRSEDRGERMTNAKIDTPELCPDKRHLFDDGFRNLFDAGMKDTTGSFQRKSVDSSIPFVLGIHRFNFFNSLGSVESILGGHPDEAAGLVVFSGEPFGKPSGAEHGRVRSPCNPVST